MNAGHWHLITGSDVAKNLFQTNMDNPDYLVFLKKIDYRFQLKTAKIPTSVMLSVN